MGLEDLRDDVKEEVEQLDDEEIEDLIDKVTTISTSMIRLDKEMEELRKEVDNIDTIMRVLISEYREMNDDLDTNIEDFSFDDDEDTESDNRWGK